MVSQMWHLRGRQRWLGMEYRCLMWYLVVCCQFGLQCSYREGQARTWHLERILRHELFVQNTQQSLDAQIRGQHWSLIVNTA